MGALITIWLLLVLFLIIWEERGPFSHYVANINASNLWKKGIHARVVKKWYGWTLEVVK